eukprot:TRINITY_DN7614_c0_g1_i1.p1 TRINITY_DN7614_c0_g1~~TRINITY_DN7614_c0_g1_i1.p1  ORF type:complete len:726 (-),score=211.79 TRINITY_DN7614_c0_g1_i1:105-2237(-)
MKRIGLDKEEEDEDEEEISQVLKTSLEDFPVNSTIKERSGLLWGMNLNPLAISPLKEEEILEEKELERCSECFAYFNRYSGVNSSKSEWFCSLCRCINHEPVMDRSSFAPNKKMRASQSLMEVRIAEDSSNVGGIPLFLSLVDVSSSSSSMLDVVKESIISQLEILPEKSLFGLITFGDSIGLYDLSHSIPHLLHIPILKGEAGCYVQIQEVLPLSRLFVKIEDNKENILNAIASIRISSNESNGFGTCVEYLLDYFEVNPVLKFNRVSVFISGPCNHGVGRTDDSSHSLLPLSSFYKEQASRASDLGVCFDLYLIKPKEDTEMGLATFKFLSLSTGGNVRLYRSTIDCTLPQDIFRQYSGTIAFNSLVRIRTSKEFTVQSVYGHHKEDEKNENLYQLAGVDSFQSISFQFQFTSGESLMTKGGSLPTIQVAFAYYFINEKEDERILERRLRVITVQRNVSRSVKSTHKSANAEIVFGLLTQKLMRSVLDNGFKESQLFLMDWLTILFTQYCENVNDGVLIDIRTSDLLMSLARFAHSLSVNDLLSTQLQNQSDLWNSYYSLYTAINPELLRNAIYPSVISLSEDGKIIADNLPPQFSSLFFPNVSFIIVDQLFSIHVYQKEEANFPSEGKQFLNQSRNSRPITSKLVQHAAGEKGGIDGEGSENVKSFESFLKHLESEASKLLLANEEEEEKEEKSKVWSATVRPPWEA